MAGVGDFATGIVRFGVVGLVSLLWFAGDVGRHYGQGATRVGRAPMFIEVTVI